MSVPEILKRSWLSANSNLNKYYDKDLISNSNDDCRYDSLLIDSGKMIIYKKYSCFDLMKFILFNWGSKFSSYGIKLRNRVTQNDVTLQVTCSKFFIEILLSSY